MPNIAEFHPQIVHFVIAGAGLGIFFRWVSLTGKLKWTDAAATALIVMGAVAAWFAVRSGVEAHGVAERVPGAVRAVQLHEAQGIETRNLLLFVAALELVALVPLVAKWKKFVLIGSALAGAWAATAIYESGRLGGELVYSFAGGVGTRSGDTTDVNRALMAAMYHRAALSRTQKNDSGAATEFAAMAARFPEDQTAQVMAVESLLLDKKDFAGALTAVRKLPVPPDTARIYTRFHIAKSDAFVGLGMKDSARAILTPLAAKFPANVRVKTKLDELK